MSAWDWSQPAIGEAAIDLRGAFELSRRRSPFVHAAAGRRDERVISRLRGKYSRSRVPCGPPGDVALDATLRAAAGRSVGRPRGPMEIRGEDLREKVRRHRSPFVIAFVMDNSWSIQVDATIERTKGVVLELLKDAHTHHDRVALVAFRHNRQPDATVCLPATTSYALAVERLSKIRVSGSTPLPDGIRKAYHVLRQQRIKYQNAVPVMVIVTDGLPNVPLAVGGDPYAEIAGLCRQLHWEGYAVVVVDTGRDEAGPARNYCREMAALSGGQYLPLARLTRQSLVAALAPGDSGPVAQNAGGK